MPVPPILPVVVLQDAATAQPLADALTAGGIPIAEITLRTPAALDGLARIADRDDILVGAGTVLTAKEADRAIAAGARFVVSPCLVPDVLGRAADFGVPAIPGVATPSELMQARELGHRLVKVFPFAAMGGPALIAAMSAIMPDMAFLPTGGITAESFADYLSLPATAGVGGSWMVPARAIADGDFAIVRRLADEAVRLAADIVAQKEAWG